MITGKASVGNRQADRASMTADRRGKEHTSRDAWRGA
jgi:hypothetical protein